MSKNQRHFWETVQGLARATRTARKVDLDTAADALELEQLAEGKIQQLAGTIMLAAARRDPAATAAPGAAPFFAPGPVGDRPIDENQEAKG
jgi:hypothetical protein